MKNPKIASVKHVNKIVDFDDPKKCEVFCKKAQKIVSADLSKCDKCPYFVGAGQGDVVICEWEDTLATGDYATKVVNYGKAKQELFRVSRLIDQGILKRG